MTVSHATIIVADMDESVRFHREVMGFEVDGEFKPVLSVVVTLMKGQGDAMVELIKNTEDSVGLHSAGMEVEDVSATVDEFEARGPGSPWSPCRRWWAVSLSWRTRTESTSR